MDYLISPTAAIIFLIAIFFLVLGIVAKARKPKKPSPTRYVSHIREQQEDYRRRKFKGK